MVDCGEIHHGLLLLWPIEQHSTLYITAIIACGSMVLYLFCKSFFALLGEE
jgi:hypothetical protein